MLELTEYQHVYFLQTEIHESLYKHAKRVIKGIFNVPELNLHIILTKSFADIQTGNEKGKTGGDIIGHKLFFYIPSSNVWMFDSGETEFESF